MCVLITNLLNKMLIDSEYLAFEEEFPKHFSDYYAYKYYHFSMLAY